MIRKKLSIEEFLKSECYKPPVKTSKLSEDDLPECLTEFLSVLMEPNKFYLIDSIEYDSVLYTGTDNIYFSYGFNPYTSRSLHEILFILPSLQINKTSDTSYELVEYDGVIHTITLRDLYG